MATQATRTSLSALLALSAIGVTSVAPSIAATLEGRVQYPGRAVPAATLYVRNVDTGALESVALRRNEATYRFELPPGKYWVFVRPEEPGLTELYGGHTRYSACRLQPSNPEEACTDHGLNAVDLTQVRRQQADVDDWFLDDASASALDQVLGASDSSPDDTELGRPRFSEYRAGNSVAVATRPVIPADSKAAPFSRELIKAAGAGSNFAGNLVLVPLSCGENCVQVAVIDLSDGVVLFPEVLSGLSTLLPCRTEEMFAYRDDSRLLEVTRAAEEGIETDYLLWQPQRRGFSALAKYRRNEDRFCAKASPTEDDEGELPSPR